VPEQRFLVATADDFGIGDATSRAILDLAGAGRITSTVLLVNSPHAESAVNAWLRAGKTLELGWHPCLTLDQPVAPLNRVSSLVDENGNFWPLGRFIRHLWLGRINAVEIEIELRAQYLRFRQLVGQFPSVVNAHHHVQIFRPVGSILRGILRGQQPLPYIRRIREPLRTLWQVPGARNKRVFLSTLGRWDARQQEGDGFAGNDWLAGITDPPYAADPKFLARWLHAMPAKVVELTCHPGYFDRSLIGRDCQPDDGQLQRRVHEFALLSGGDFLSRCRQEGFALIAPAALSGYPTLPSSHAA
jgi:predicted glycoside hydrolase/deacetylase ChbG (UPF0249 family)